MEYTVQKLAKLAGISSRTLRYYDEINILKPARINSSGYRIYGETEVNKLQQILFYKELDINLEKIKEIVLSPSFDGVSALKEHHEKLLAKREQLDVLIANVEKTIANSEGRIKMTDKEKFEGFKQNMVEENEKKYGKEIREKYGEEAINSSNKKLLNMTKEEYDEVTSLEKQIKDTLKDAIKTGNPAGELAQKAAYLHKKWLCFYWDKYTGQAHASLADMYVCDERFKAYYDEIAPGSAEFLRDAIHIMVSGS